MTQHSQLAYLHHVRDALRSVSEYTRDGHSTFVASKLIQDAVLRNLEVIGEAVKHLATSLSRTTGTQAWDVAT
jgi:uncharacterized protein with HEPN domain